MARTSKKAKPVPVETVEAVADTEIRSADNIAAKIVAAVPETGAEGLVTGKATAPVAPIVNGATIYVPLNRLDDDDGVRVTEDGEIIEDDDPDEGDGTVPDPEDEEPEDDGKPISDALVRDLTAHCTLGLRLALGERPDIALIAVAHPLVAQTFYRGGGGEAHCLEIRPASTGFAGHADGIEDTAATKALADRHVGWAGDLPRDMGVALGPHRRAGPCQRHGTVRPLRLAHRQRCASALGAQAPSAGDCGQSEATALALEMTPIGSPPRAQLFWTRHQDPYPHRGARGSWRRGGGSHGGQEEAGNGGRRRAAACGNRMAPAADAHSAPGMVGCRSRRSGSRAGGAGRSSPEPVDGEDFTIAAE
jgi:hypothetical protein